MKIKQYPNGNQYALTKSGKWVRNFTLSNVPFIDINETIQPDDHFTFVRNEFENNLNKYAWIDTEKFYFPNIIIISDGYNFEKKHKIINEIKNIQNVTIIGVNGSLKKWNCDKSMSFYLTNNPYEECMKDLPRKRMLPRCITSSRTNCNFLRNYNGTKFRYNPVKEKTYNGINSKESEWNIDDYRNPICAAIGLAFKFGVEKLLLMFCDDSFETERPGAIKLENGLWTYPQHIIAHEIIDANMFWLKNQEYNEVKIGNYSKGPICEFAAYIEEEEEEELMNFFN